MKVFPTKPDNLIRCLAALDKMQFLQNRDIIISKFKLIILKSPSNALCEILREREREREGV